MSGWTRKREGSALGVAHQVKDDTLAAGVAEVSVDRATGKIKVHNFWCAIDAGIAVQPRNIAAQTEGGIIMGSATCCARKSSSRTAACSSRTTPTTRWRACPTCPTSRCKVVSTDNPPTGAGEDGLPLVAGAVGNAIATLTGVRLRELPFAPDRVRGALGA